MSKIKIKQNLKGEITNKVKEELKNKMEREIQQAKTLRQYLSKVNKTPSLNSQEEKKLARKTKEGDKKAREKLFKTNLKLVVSIAKKYSTLPYTSPYFTFLELIASGQKALERAIIRFDWTKGCRFSTYANWWIKQAIAEAIIRKRNLITTGENLTIFIHKDKKGYVTEITASGIRNGIHVQEGFIGTNEERQKYAQELSEKWKELEGAEKEAKKTIKKDKKTS